MRDLRERYLRASYRITELEQALAEAWKDRDFYRNRLEVAHKAHRRTHRVASVCIYTLFGLLILALFI
jgi:hypothetical protein